MNINKPTARKQKLKLTDKFQFGDRITIGLQHIKLTNENKI